MAGFVEKEKAWMEIRRITEVIKDNRKQEKEAKKGLIIHLGKTYNFLTGRQMTNGRDANSGHPHRLSSPSLAR